MDRQRQLIEGRLDAYTFESVAVSSGAVPLTFTNLKPSTGRSVERVLMTVEGDQIRYTYDGTTPTALVGHLANVGDVIIINGNGNCRRFQAIRVTTDASLKTTYER